MNTTNITTFGPGPDGSRLSAFEVDGLRVTVVGREPADNARAVELARNLAGAAVAIGQLRAQVADAAAQLEALRKAVPVATKPPSNPARVLGRGFVRFDGTELWALNRRERGFGEFGFCFASWDEFFRRFNVRIVEHGSDEHGPWWAFESCSPESFTLDRP